MNYEDARKYLAGQSKSGMNLGLGRMKELCRRLGNPEKKLSFIHIAGTNGKGSTAAFLSSMLAVHGLVVGRYVSPVVFRYEECIQYEDIKGIHFIEKELLAEIVTKTAVAVEEMQREEMESPTIFEIETAMSFLAFEHWQCSVVVLEVGLGGREDATNVVENVAAFVITPIGMDHMTFLGNTIEKIAAEKAGIIKDNGLVITNQPEKKALSVIREETKERHAALYTVSKEDITVLSAGLGGTVFSYKGKNYRIDMPGMYQVENAALALEVCDHLSENPQRFTGEKISLTTEEKMVGLRNTFWGGRFEVISSEPLIILDGAHNPAGAKALADSIEELLPGRKLHGIMGVFADKDYESIVEILFPYFSDIVTITPSSPRGLAKEELAKVWRKCVQRAEETGKSCFCREIQMADSPMEGLKKILSFYKEGDAVILFGSLSFFKELNWK